MPSGQSKTIEQPKFTYSPLGKVFEKQMETTEERVKKRAEALEVLKPNTQQLTIKDKVPENKLSKKAKNEPNKTEEVLE